MPGAIAPSLIYFDAFSKMDAFSIEVLESQKKHFGCLKHGNDMSSTSTFQIHTLRN